MTESEALALPPRELDALVAERVMGLDLGEVPEHEWGVLHFEEWDSYQSTSQCKRCGELSGWEDIGFLREAPGGPCQKHPKPYTTSISAAWPVVEKMREEGWSLSLRLWTNEDHEISDDFDGPFYESDFSKEESVCDCCSRTAFATLEAESQSAPLAICLAALRAKGVIE